MQRIFLKLQSQDNPLVYFYFYRLKKSWNALRFKGLKVPQGGWPILFGISIPKSGTHLLSQILTGFSKVSPVSPYEQYIGLGPNLDIRRRQEKFGKQLEHLRPLDVALAHLPASQENLQSISAPRFLPFFIMRDPRDIVVSLSHFAEKTREHRLHSYYAETLKSMDERILASIQGVRTADHSVRSIGKQIEIHIGWLNHPDTLFLRFEDLIENRRPALETIAEHFLRRVDTLTASREEIIAALEASINPSKSSTFRSGKTGEWKKYFSEEHRKIFKDVAGDLLIRLGYESNNDW